MNSRAFALSCLLAVWSAVAAGQTSRLPGFGPPKDGVSLPGFGSLAEPLPTLIREAHSADGADQHVYLLHSRLSIIDLDERSNQPFRLDSKVLISNSELYNYVELRQELQTAGEDFHTPGDIEVLAARAAGAWWHAGCECSPW